jgi:hypothetical protein
MELLAIVARLGLALFLTASFAAGMSLNTGMTLASPNMLRACEGVFFWALALISCTTSRHPSDVGPVLTGRERCCDL